MGPSEHKGPYTVQFDIAITRRLKMHAVCDRTGRQVYHSRRIADVFAWLLEIDAGEFTMLDEDIEFRVSLKPPLPPTSPTKG